MAELTVDCRPGDWRADGDDGPSPAVRECVATAAAAPSVHNTQPWLFRPRRGGIDVYADRSRHLQVIDPAGRELAISVGAAVFNLRAAVAVRGRAPMLQVLPQRGRPDLFARVLLGRPAAVSATVRALAWAIPRRRSNRWPFAGTAVPPDILAELVHAARTEGAGLRILGATGRAAVLSLVSAAEHSWAADPLYRQELAAWTHNQTRRHDGVPATTFGPLSASPSMPLRDLGLARPAEDRHVEEFEPTPTIAVLHTADTPVGWLRAGQALQRVLLTATVRGLATTLMTQPLEIPTLRAMIVDPYTGQPAQAIIRLGYGQHHVRPAPRRPVTAVLYEPTPNRKGLPPHRMGPHAGPTAPLRGRCSPTTTGQRH